MIANDELSREGEKQIESVVQNWLRSSLPYLPEEGIQVIHIFLECFLQIINKKLFLLALYQCYVHTGNNSI